MSPPPPQHCTPGVQHGTPPAFMEHPPPPQHCTLGVLHGTPPAFMEHPPPPLPHTTAHRLYYTVRHQPLWNTPLPPSPTALHTGCTTRYGRMGGNGRDNNNHFSQSYFLCFPKVQGLPRGFLCINQITAITESKMRRKNAHRVYNRVPHQPLWNTPLPPFPPSPQHCTPGVLHGTPPAFMEHPPPPLPHSTAHRVYYTVPHQPLWNTPPPPPQHCTPGVLHGTPPAFMEHPPPRPPPQHCTPGVQHSTPPAFMEHPLPPSPTPLHTGCTTRYGRQMGGHGRDNNNHFSQSYFLCFPKVQGLPRGFLYINQITAITESKMRRKNGTLFHSPPFLLPFCSHSPPFSSHRGSFPYIFRPDLLMISHFPPTPPPPIYPHFPSFPPIPPHFSPPMTLARHPVTR